MATGSNSTSPTSAWNPQTSVNMTTSRYIQDPIMWIDLASVACSLKGLWPCQSRFWQRGMKPCGSAAQKRRTMKAPRGIQSSCQPETSCQWSLGVTTLTRDDSPASKRFTPQKVMQNSDICCQKGDTFFLNCNYTEQRVVRFLLKRNLHRYTEQRINEVTLIKIDSEVQMQHNI